MAKIVGAAPWEPRRVRVLAEQLRHPARTPPGEHLVGRLAAFSEQFHHPRDHRHEAFLAALPSDDEEWGPHLLPPKCRQFRPAKTGEEEDLGHPSEVGVCDRLGESRLVCEVHYPDRLLVLADALDPWKGL